MNINILTNGSMYYLINNSIIVFHLKKILLDFFLIFIFKYIFISTHFILEKNIFNN